MSAVDVLVIGAHPDDIELCCGGTVSLLTRLGKRVGLVDLTRGELGTRGDVETRRQEADRAAGILGAAFRRNLDLPDGDITASSENRLRLLRLFREHRPDWVLTHSQIGHPDHWSTSVLVREAVHHAGLAKLEPSWPRHRPTTIGYWLQFDSPEHPDLVVDITETWETKQEAILAHASQLHNPKSEAPETILTSPDFLDRVRAQNRFMGSLADCAYGEGFLLSRRPRLNDLNV